jgi:hypothetical protein
MSKCPSEPAAGALLKVYLGNGNSNSKDRVIRRRFDGYETLWDVLHWLGGPGSQIPDNILGVGRRVFWRFFLPLYNGKNMQQPTLLIHLLLPAQIQVNPPSARGLGAAQSSLNELNETDTNRSSKATAVTVTITMAGMTNVRFTLLLVLL